MLLSLWYVVAELGQWTCVIGPGLVGIGSRTAMEIWNCLKMELYIEIAEWSWKRSWDWISNIPGLGNSLWGTTAFSGISFSGPVGLGSDRWTELFTGCKDDFFADGAISNKSCENEIDKILLCLLFSSWINIFGCTFSHLFWKPYWSSNAVFIHFLIVIIGREFDELCGHASC